MITDKTQKEIQVNLGNESIECVEQYEYLGALTTSNGDNIQEIRKRLAMGLNNITQLQKLWKGSDRQTQIKTIRACVFPTATYGCETWTLYKAARNQINAFEMKCYGKMMRIPWTEH